MQSHYGKFTFPVGLIKQNFVLAVLLSNNQELANNCLQVELFCGAHISIIVDCESIAECVQ